jgi:hypothetical protein
MRKGIAMQNARPLSVHVKRWFHIYFLTVLFFYEACYSLPSDFTLITNHKGAGRALSLLNIVMLNFSESNSLQVIGYADTDVAEFVYKNNPSADQLMKILCKDLSKACAKDPPPVPKVSPWSLPYLKL